MPSDKNEAKKIEKLLAEEAELEHLVRESGRRQELAKNFIVAYLGIAVAILTYFASTSNFSFNFGNKQPNKDNASLQVQVNQLKKQLSEVQDQLKTKGDTPDTAVLSARVDNMQTQLDSLSATILESPDKALTARLLREKQNNLEAQVRDLKDENIATRQAFINLIVVVFGTPLIGGVVALVIDRFKRQKTDSKSNR